jgi:beta-lactamase superfamily II metal-dependent hydrolase
MRLARCVIAVFAVCLLPLSLAAQQLEIHYIDVGWGGSVFVKGPDGTTVLMEAGNTGLGTRYVVPYLESIGVMPAGGLDYVIGGHQHCDHIGGLDEVINAGYDVRVKQYSNGSSYASSCVDGWNAAAATTTAGAPVVMPVGTVIQLGNGATITCVARNGSIIGGGSVSVSDENDRSIALLIKYGGFDYLWASDLGGGSDSCTGRSTTQTNVETSVIQAITNQHLITPGGIDLLHVNHHGSESSTNPDYFNLADPAVAIIGVGDGESSGWDLPRIDVVDHVLLAQSSACINIPPALVLQTEEGNPIGSLASHSGYCVGNIKITTDGASFFTVSADGAVHQGPNELAASGLPRVISIDDNGAPPPPDTTPPTAPSGLTATGGKRKITLGWTASTDNVGVTGYQVWRASSATGTFTQIGTATGTTYSDNNLASRSTWFYYVKATDAAGNVSAASNTASATVR